MLRRAFGYSLRDDCRLFTDEIQRMMVLGSAPGVAQLFLTKTTGDEAFPLAILTYQAKVGTNSLRANPLKASAAQLSALLATGAP